MDAGKFNTPTGYAKSAALAWLLYDYVITLDTEIEYIWKRRWGTVTLLFFLIRYLPLTIVVASSFTNFLPNVPPDMCDLFQWIEAAGTFIIFIVVQIVLQFRLYVMYGKSRRVLIANGFLCLVELGCAGGLVAVYFTKTTPLPDSPLVYGSCFSWSPSQVAVVLLAPLAYETYLALLALRKTFQSSGAAVGKQSGLMTLLVRDNVAYFFLVAGTLVAVTLVWFFFPVTPGNSLITYTHVSGSIGGARLIVNVRHAALAHPADADGASSFELQHWSRERTRARSLHRSEGASFGVQAYSLTSLYGLQTMEDDEREADGGAPLTRPPCRARGLLEPV